MERNFMVDPNKKAYRKRGLSRCERMVWQLKQLKCKKDLNLIFSADDFALFRIFYRFLFVQLPIRYLMQHANCGPFNPNDNDPDVSLLQKKISRLNKGLFHLGFKITAYKAPKNRKAYGYALRHRDNIENHSWLKTY